MAKILIGWEYGAGFGHVALLVPLALRLREEGHEPVLALRDARTTEPLWKDKGLTVIQAPFIPLPAHWDKTVQTDTLADIFMLAGLSNPVSMVALGKAWQDVLARVKPDVVICEFSPTLAMVTLGVIPTITLGISFAIPPTGRPLPAIRFWQQELTQTSIANEQRVYEAVSRTRAALNLPGFEFFSDIFGGEGVFVCALPELDCYGKYRTVPAIGPLTALDVSLAPTKRNPQHQRKAFAYLANDEPSLPKIMQAIQSSHLMCDSYIRRLDAATRTAYTSDNVHLYETPQPLAELLPERGLLIHHGGMSTADLALRLGIPQLIVSRHLEQKVNGGLLLHLGVAQILMSHQCEDVELISKTLKDMGNNDNYAHHAFKRAEAIAARKGKQAMEIVLEACNKLV